MEVQPTYRLRFFFEWRSTSCLWTDNDAARERFGYEVSLQQLPLSLETITQAEQISAWHDRSLNWEYPPDPAPWREEECDKFNLAVLALFSRITDELGDNYRITNQQTACHEDPDLDAFLANPSQFRRKK